MTFDYCLFVKSGNENIKYIKNKILNQAFYQANEFIFLIIFQ